MNSNVIFCNAYLFIIIVIALLFVSENKLTTVTFIISKKLFENLRMSCQEAAIFNL